MLHRAARVIQHLYYILLRKSFRHTVEKVDRVDENTVFVHTAAPDVLRGRNSILSDPSPGSLSSDLADELAALTMNGCGNSVVMMGPSVQIMLKGKNVWSSLRPTTEGARLEVRLLTDLIN